ncbi:MAG: hypothetical protein IPI95_16830 [Flavobacteriales bacterium]|nr:hypothetical protein [Flavobacteriales bacterium]
MPTYADIILPLAVPGVFTYEVPEALAGRVTAGIRVVAAFGRGRKMYSGLVLRTHGKLPEGRIARPILEVLDEAPVATEEQLALWQAISEHYMCTLGEVMLAAMPGPLVLSSSTRLVAAPGTSPAWTGDNKRDILLDAMERRHELSLQEAGELIGLKDPMRVIKKLMDAGALMLAEELKDTYKPRMERYVRLSPDARSEEALHHWFDTLERAPKQLHLLMRYIELSRCLSDASARGEAGRAAKAERCQCCGTEPAV